MDHGRRIDKTVTPVTSKRPKLPFVTTTDSSLVKDEPIAEDHRLVNWKRWSRRHRRQYQALDKGEPRSRTNLVMSSYAEERPYMEMRSLMEYAATSILPGCHKYQGLSGFWKIPPFLSNHGNSCLSKVGPVLTKKELNLPPILEYVDTPMCLRDEKNLPNCTSKLPNWKHSSYLKKRRQELAETIAILQPNPPDTVNLIARGQGFGHVVKDVSHIPVISVMDISLGNDDAEVEELRVNTDVAVALKINDLEIRRGGESIGGEITWTLNFSNKVSRKSEQRLRFENTGNSAITYQWRSAIITPSRNDVSFFFNKNKTLILPGQKVVLPIWFQKQKAGTFTEAWRLNTDPIVSKAPLVIRLLGYAASEDSFTSQVDVDVYLDRCIGNTAVRETIDETIRNIRPVGPPEAAYKTFFLEDKLFRAKNPSYFYHASLVSRFHRLYGTDSATDAASSWTLSLTDLRRILLQIENPDLRHERLKEFSNLCYQCLSPSLYNPIQNTKYATVYNILCASVNRMEDERDFVERNSTLTGNNGAMITEREGRMVSEEWPDRVLDNSAKNKRGSRASRSSRNSVPVLDVSPPTAAFDRTGRALHREVFFVRVYELLVGAIEQACAVIDSLNNLHESEV